MGCASAQMDVEMKEGKPLVEKPKRIIMDRGDGDGEGKEKRDRGGGGGEEGTLDEEDDKDAWWAKK